MAHNPDSSNAPIAIRVAMRAPLALTTPVLLVLLALLCCGLALPAAAGSDGQSADDRELEKLYRQTLWAIRKGHKTNIHNGMQALADYPLYPYLEKARLSRTLKQLPRDDVDHFLATYDGSVVAHQLRRSWLNVLAKKGQWQDYLHYYQADAATSSQRCDYLEALYHTGREQLSLSLTADIWLSGKSLPDSCDPVFERWQQAGLRTDALVWQRVKLAINQRNTLLARYLSKRASPELRPYTRRLLSVHYSPSRLTHVDEFNTDNAYTADIVSHGLIRLASRDAHLSSDLWVRYRSVLNLSPEQNAVIRDKIARQLIASGWDDALNWLIAQDPNAEDSYLLEWRIRLALRQQQWQQAGRWINLLPDEVRQEPRWRYWLARSLESSKPQQANSLLQTLAGERHYYGFLAADLLQRPYGFNNAEPDGDLQDELEHLPAITRARLFYAMNELTSARREWFAATRQLNREQLLGATQLAHRWGWHQQAILTAIKADHWDNLSVRFPLAFRQNMQQSADKAAIRIEWLYAIARQESAFAEDARSSAGAKGLMQLMPGTARQVAKSLGLTISSRDLYRADTNIELGSNYLKQLLNKFDGNAILATAAYNAGPNKVDAWLRSQPRELPFDVWIETLPFHETRNYVQNVLAFSVIYGHRLGLDTQLMPPQTLTISFNTHTEEN